MADYLTTTEELTSIADTIRSKGGTTALLTYPNGFVAAINNIEINPITMINVNNATATKITGTTDDYLMAMS